MLNIGERPALVQEDEENICSINEDCELTWQRATSLLDGSTCGWEDYREMIVDQASVDRLWGTSLCMIKSMLMSTS